MPCPYYAVASASKYPVLFIGLPPIPKPAASLRNTHI